CRHHRVRPARRQVRHQRRPCAVPAGVRAGGQVPGPRPRRRRLDPRRPRLSGARQRSKRRYRNRGRRAGLARAASPGSAAQSLVTIIIIVTISGPRRRVPSMRYNPASPPVSRRQTRSECLPPPCLEPLMSLHVTVPAAPRRALLAAAVILASAAAPALAETVPSPAAVD